MDIHFYITPSDFQRYLKEGVCYITIKKSDDLFHISFDTEKHTIERSRGYEDEYILRKNSIPKNIL